MYTQSTRSVEILIFSITISLFSLCSSSRFLICGPDFLSSLHQSPLLLTDLPLFFFCLSSFPPRRTEHLSALLALLTQERPAFAQSYHSMCGQACMCVGMCTLLIHGIAVILLHFCPLLAHHRPLKGRISCRFLSDGLLLKCFMFYFTSVIS